MADADDVDQDKNARYEEDEGTGVEDDARGLLAPEGGEVLLVGEHVEDQAGDADDEEDQRPGDKGLLDAPGQQGGEEEHRAEQAGDYTGEGGGGHPRAWGQTRVRSVKAGTRLIGRCTHDRRDLLTAARGRGLSRATPCASRESARSRTGRRRSRTRRRGGAWCRRCPSRSPGHSRRSRAA